MIDLLWASLAALVVVVLVFFLTFTFERNRSNWPAWTALTVACVTWFVCGLITLIVLSERSVGRTTCRNWSAETGYKTKFKILNWADGGQCLALAPNGRWVLNTQVVTFANRSRP